MKSGLRRAGYALGSVGSSLRLLRFATALRVTRRTPGREELSWPKASFRPSLTGSPTDGLQATRGGGSHFHRPDRSRVKTTGQVEVLMTCNLASLSGAMYHGFEGAISTFGVYFPYLNLALKWSNEPGPPHKHLLQKFDNVENWKMVWAGRRCDSLINGMIKREGNHRDEWPVGNILDPYSPYSFSFYPSDPSSLTYLSSVFSNPHWKVWKAPKRSGGWEVVLKLVPISPESKSFGGARSSRLTFGVGPAGSVSYSYPLVRRIKEKARKYGDLDSKGSSILVFVHSRGMGFSSDLVKEFLYGHFSGPGKTDTSNSLWDVRRKEKGSRVWGVWAFQNLQFPLRSREVETKGCLFLSPLVSFHQGNLDRLRKAGFLDHQHGILIERPDSRDKFEVKIVTPQSNADNVWAPPLKVPNYREGMKTLFEKAKSGLSGAISSPAEELLGVGHRRIK